jgi:ankyrin repeat protein
MVELLLKHRSPLNPTDISGQTPLHHAIAEGHGDTAVALLKAGAETDKKDVDGCLAIDLAPDAQVRPHIRIASLDISLTPPTRSANISYEQLRTRASSYNTI